MALWKISDSRTTQNQKQVQRQLYLTCHHIKMKNMGNLHFQILKYRFSVEILVRNRKLLANHPCKRNKTHCCWTAPSWYLCTPHPLQWFNSIFNLQKVFRYGTRIFYLMSNRQLIFPLTHVNGLRLHWGGNKLTFIISIL